MKKIELNRRSLILGGALSIAALTLRKVFGSGDTALNQVDQKIETELPNAPQLLTPATSPSPTFTPTTSPMSQQTNAATPLPTATKSRSINSNSNTATNANGLPLLIKGRESTLDDVPIGSWISATTMVNGIESQLFVSRSSAKNIKAYSATCPHKGITLSLIGADQIECRSGHGLKYDPKTGKGIDNSYSLGTLDVIAIDQKLYVANATD